MDFGELMILRLEYSIFLNIFIIFILYIIYNLISSGVSNDNGPCTETYPGPAPFSDIETKSLSNYIKSICDKFYIYLSFHSYSQLLMFPYSYTVEHVDNYNDLVSNFNYKTNIALRNI